NAVKYGHETGNTQLTNLAGFWQAECLYRTNDFNGSLHILNRLTGNSQFKGTAEYPTAIYNRGYNQFKLGNYPAAIESFASYLALLDNRGGYVDEARVRLADSYFMNRNYSQAADIYNQIAQLESYKDLYAPLQCAVAYGLVSDDIRKIDVLEKITAPEYSSDKLYTQALYELGRTYVQNAKDKEAMAVLDKLINNPADSLFYHKALLEAGMINANKGKYDTALEYYKQIIEDKNISEESQSALAGIENIYAQQNKQADFLAYLDKVGLSETKSASERETMLFNSAEQVFLSGNYTAALNSLQQFLEKYPDGAKTSQAKFYMAESYNKLGKAEAAAKAYMQVMMSNTKQEDAFTEIATLNYAKLSFQLQKYEEAVRAYETIEQIAKLGNNKAEGTIGKMRSYFNLQDYRSALAAATEVLALNLKNGAVIREANYIKAKSLLANGERENGSKILEALAKEPTDAYGAEAAYLLILDAYDAGEFEQVENLTFALSDSGTPQTYWLAKSFITLGDSYAERDNLEQARATFESIKENYSPASQDDIIQQVDMRLGKLAKLQ
ncbi:MAG: tetratricopeptide repeat protein, partial [Bacteroidales bacterium]|nr:tetratricopeptide repeat protein [Bacteroidales bacterium]